jgi:hypothetical protein
MSMTEAKPTHNDEIEDLDVILVGAGFAGFYLLLPPCRGRLNVAVATPNGDLSGSHLKRQEDPADN